MLPYPFANKLFIVSFSHLLLNDLLLFGVTALQVQHELTRICKDIPFRGSYSIFIFSIRGLQMCDRLSVEYIEGT